MHDTYKYQARRDISGEWWNVGDRTDSRYWTVSFSPLGEPHIVNWHTGIRVDPYDPTGRPIINAVRRALETDAKK